ncbi:MAG: hypothetical protein IKK87_10035 [Bacteroidaceae bacterium]|nr:hypothetical protein [Bacteroidaceae bacterium]
MKKFFVSLVMLLSTSAVSLFAQSSMLATLSHDGEISTFYGATALRDAYNASKHGDIITLSSGSFTAVNISKALTIRGAGMQVDTAANTFPTVISGDFTINIPDTVTQRLTMEGLYNHFTVTVGGTLKDASFLKCKFKAFRYANSTSTKMKNLTFIHCRISDGLNLPNESSASCVNCYIYAPNTYSLTSSNFEFSNCIIIRTTSYLRNSIYSSSFFNCIIYNGNVSSTDYLDSSNTAYYCLGKAYGDRMFQNIPNTTNTKLTADLNTVFKTYTGSYNDDETFELTDEAKAKYLGADKTQVGIYGGNLPFDPTPTNPQITKCNVASKSTADGKLSVDIEVSAAE